MPPSAMVLSGVVRRVAAHVASFVLYNHSKEDRNSSGWSDAARWPPQRFDWIPSLGCNLAAQSVTLEFDKNGRPASGAMAASVRNAPSRGRNHDESAQRNCGRLATGPG